MSMQLHIIDLYITNGFSILNNYWEVYYFLNWATVMIIIYLTHEHLDSL